MSIINNLKAMLGFPDKEDMGNENSSQTNSPITFLPIFRKPFGDLISHPLLPEQ